MIDFVEELNRIDFDFGEEPVQVICIKKFETFDIDNISVHIPEGQSAKVPYWIAEILLERDLVEFDSDEEINYRTMAQYAHEEGREKKLARLPSSLFIKRTRAEIKRLSSENNKMAIRKLTSIEGSFNKIMRNRMKKILQEAIVNANENKQNPNLLEEEVWLLNHLRFLLKNWQSQLGLPPFE